MPEPQPKQRVAPPANPNAPTLTREGYYTSPPLKLLRRLGDEELAALERFVVGRDDTGEVQFLQVRFAYSSMHVHGDSKMTRRKDACEVQSLQVRELEVHRLSLHAECALRHRTEVLCGMPAVCISAGRELTVDGRSLHSSPIRSSAVTHALERRATRWFQKTSQVDSLQHAFRSFCILCAQPVDVRKLDLDALVDIEKGKILLYPEATAAPATAAEQLAARKPGAAAAEKAARTAAKSRKSLATDGAQKPQKPAAAAAPPPPQTAQLPQPQPAAQRPARGAGLNVPALLTFRRMLVKNRDDAAAVAKFRAKLEAHAAKIGAVFVHYEAASGTWVMKVDGL